SPPRMRIAQIVPRNASEYEKKCQRVDRVALAAEHEIVADEQSADVVHVYGKTGRLVTPSEARGLAGWVARFVPPRARPGPSLMLGVTPLRNTADEFIP